MSAALAFYDEIDRLLTTIAQYPEIDEVADDLSPRLRRLTLGNYLFFYCPVADGVELIRVLHGARDIDRLL